MKLILSTKRSFLIYVFNGVTSWVSDLALETGTYVVPLGKHVIIAFLETRNVTGRHV